MRMLWLTLIILGTIRFLVPLTIFRWPLVGYVLSMFADTIDYPFMPHNTPEQMRFYEQWDKLFDLYFLAIACYTVRNWKDELAKKWAIGLFIYRLVGTVLFEI